jgi:two-component system, cell cycle sensor histidine kinase and response regulator CckA
VSTPKPTPESIRPTELARLELLRLVPDPGQSLITVFRRACELAARAIRVERVGVWLFVEDRSAIRCVALFEKVQNEYSEGAILRVADFPTYFSSLQIRKAVPAELATSDPRTAELADAYLHPLGITSMLDAGIYRNTDLVGVVCHESLGPPREWTTEDRDFAGSVADLLALKMEAATVEELRAASRTQEDRLLRLEKADAQAQLAAGVAHDFRNLLTVIAGHAEMLAGRTDLPKETRTQLQAMTEAATRGTDLVQELLEFARPNGRPPVAIHLGDATTEFLPILRATLGAGRPIDYTPPPVLGRALMNKTDYCRILLNLVTNAGDASPAGQPVTVRVRPIKAHEGAGPESHYIMLEVADRGPGMDEATARRVFEPYFTTKPKGTGLGLPIVRKLMDRAGGFLRVESRPGRGTIVRCFFPRVGASSGGTQEFAIPPELFSKGTE